MPRGERAGGSGEKWLHGVEASTGCKRAFFWFVTGSPGQTEICEIGFRVLISAQGARDRTCPHFPSRVRRDGRPGAARNPSYPDGFTHDGAAPLRRTGRAITSRYIMIEDQVSPLRRNLKLPSPVMAIMTRMITAGVKLERSVTVHISSSSVSSKL